ncbi:MAG TPA: tRNA pseudouridine(38-40) synthase TruA [Vicinamibacterales bacterium]|jgi:tRNA pseudouridine38-40 synthase|nr:tRNA pseudouridine(38-40) synthase TruA [Vicinamibacterales bacterium]
MSHYPLRTLKLTLTYDGTRFVGWQRQAEGESIQGLLETALARLEGAPITVHGAGRTDAGVHALGQVASASVSFSHDHATVLRSLNAQLPADVRVLAVDEAAPAFHARFSARLKTYRYQIAQAPVASPFGRAFAWHVREPLDVAAMQTAAATLVGTHDFAAFQSTGSPAATTVRTIARSEWRRQATGVDGSDPDHLLLYEVSGDGFLRHMVRTVVGTLVEVGRGWRPPSSIAELLDGGTRGAAGPTAPAHGLFLVQVEYD